jgi:molybdate transport system substrate-binding protein
MSGRARAETGATSRRRTRRVPTVRGAAWLASRIVATSVAGGGVAACGPSASDGGTLNVYAASSLTEAFGDMERIFEAMHPDADVALTFAGSQVLRLQIEQGAPADVFASANPAHTEALADEGLVSMAWTFAHNELVVVVPLDDPAGIASFAELADAERIVVGAESVPVGRYTREALERARATLGSDFTERVMARVVSEETNVRLARAKVELGEADAAVVYRTDAASSDRVRTIEVPPEVNVRADYLIGLVVTPGESDSARGRLAAAWIELVRSPEGQAVLRRHGFTIP